MNFDLQTFPAFADLLTATNEFAKSSGFRFRTSDLPEHPLVAHFMQLVRIGDEPVRKDIERAVKICEQESIRNVMMTTCKELHLWPPLCEDRLQSMAFTDTSEPLETIAWALFNFQSNLEAAPETLEARAQLQRTASYIVDFAHAAGCDSGNEMSKSGRDLLLDFLARVKEWTDAHKYQQSSLRKAVLEKLHGLVDERYIDELDRWFEAHWEKVAVGSIAFVAGIAIAALAFTSKTRQ
jgi:hypothetical protein